VLLPECCDVDFIWISHRQAASKKTRTLTSWLPSALTWKTRKFATDQTRQFCTFCVQIYCYIGWDKNVFSRYSNSLRAGRSGKWIRGGGGRPSLGPTQPPVQWTPGPFPGVKRSGRGVKHPLPSTAVLRMGWSYTSVSSLCLHRQVMRWPLPLLRDTK
jgi:hypothetical protein